MNSSSPEAAVLYVSLVAGVEEARGVQWEVCERGALDPLRYGLCLLGSAERKTSVAVTGLRPDTPYVFRLRDAGEVLAEGEFKTASRLSGRFAA